MKYFGGTNPLPILAGLIVFIIFSSCSNHQTREEYVPDSPLSASSGDMGTELTNSGGLDLTPEIFVQMGHTDDGYTANTTAVFTPDGRYVLTGSKDGTVKLWETHTGREVRTFRCMKDVSHIDVSHDGRYLVSGDRFFGYNIKVWDIGSGKIIQSFAIDVLNGPPVVFCHGGSSLLAGGNDGLLRLWNMSSGKLIREYKAGIYGEVTALAVTPDETRAIAAYSYHGENQAGMVNTIRVWDIDTGGTILSFNNASASTVALAVTPDGSQLLSSDWGQDSVSAWDIDSGTLTKTFVTGGTSAIAISAGGRYALFGGYMNVRLVELDTGREIRNMDTGIRDWVQSIHFSPDGRVALVGDQAPQPSLWDLDSGELIRTFGGYSGQTLTIGMAGAGRVLMTAHGNSRSVSLWDVKNGIQSKRIENEPTCLSTSACISSDGSTVAFGGWDMAAHDSYVSLWSTASGEKLIQLNPPEKTSVHPNAPLMTGDGRRIIWALGSEIITSSAKDGSELKRFRLGFADIRDIRRDPAETFILTCNDLNDSTLLDMDTGEILKTYKQAACAFSRDGKKIYALTVHSESAAVLTVTDVSTLKEKSLFEVGFDTLIQTNGSSIYNTIRQLIAGPNKNELFFFDSQKHCIYTIDLKLSKITAVFTGHTDTITRIDTSPDGHILYSGSHDGSTRAWDTQTGKEIARFISFSDGEWIVITPEGYFNASPNGAKYLNVRVGNRVYSIDHFYETYYNPAFVASVLQGRAVKPAGDIRKGVELPPNVRIISPVTQAGFKTEDIEITVSATDMGGGIDEIRLYHNGKAMGGDTRAIRIKPDENETEKTKTYAVTLVSGLNTFKAVGFSRDRTESNPSEITVRLLAPDKETSLHVLAVGINAYKNPALNLNYAEPDARSIADFFRGRGRELFKQARVTEIYNAQATKHGILAGLNTLSNTDPQDAVLIYLAGHGENINETWYFIPHELTYPEREEDVLKKAMSSDELSLAIKNIKAQKVLVLIDACKSGAVLVAFRGFEDRKALSQLSRATGVHVVAASSKDQFASEIKTLGHGVFTYTLLEGLNGEAAGNGEPVTVRKLMAYIEETLPDVTRKYRQEAQYPVIDSKGMDFPLVNGR